MLLKLSRRSKIWHDAGDTVNVSPADADFLIACGTAVPLVTDKSDGADTTKSTKKASAKK